MAVLISHRGQGVGTALLAAAESKAREQALGQVFLHAQTHAIPFYLRFGYAVCSDEFLDAGIPHRSMQKTL
jgi:predicted GNAT family N-acyltransferase